MSRATCLVSLLLLLDLTACKKEPTPPPTGRMAPRGLPPLDPAAAAAAPAPAPPPGAAAAPPGHAHAGSPEAAAAAVVEGTLEVTPELAAKVKPGDVIFVTARPLDATGAVGRTIAADRLELKGMPSPFTLTAAHRMSDAPLTGPMLVTARLDRDSEAMTREAGDLEGSVKVELPAKGVKITLDTEVKP